MKVLFVEHVPLARLGHISFNYPLFCSKTEEVLLLCPAPSQYENKTVDYRSLPFEIKFFKHAEAKLNCLKISSEIHTAAESFGPDIIHFFYGKFTPLYVALLRVFLPSNAKLVVDIQSPLVGVGWFKRWAAAQLIPLFSHGIFCYSPAVPKAIIPFSWKPTSIIPLGVDLSLITPQKPKGSPPRRFVYVGTLSPYRQLGVMIKAFAGCISKEPSLTLDIIGGGESFDALRTLVSRLGAQENIRMLGFFEQAKLFLLLPGYDMGLAYVPHQYYDPAPSLKVNEYAAAGLPFIASDTHGHREMRKYGLDMPLFGNTIEEIAVAVLQAAEQIPDPSRIRANLKAVKRLDWAYVVENHLIPAYEKILA